jgi:hypothetical protein
MIGLDSGRLDFLRITAVGSIRLKWSVDTVFLTAQCSNRLYGSDASAERDTLGRETNGRW